ncbi:MAG: aminopeptidase [Gammaproteobacteria bacterium]|nr:aminopeptidase [Gammaproteobacteria bacterium]
MSPPSCNGDRGAPRGAAAAVGRCLGLLGLLLTLGGCETLGYYTQAASGHLELMRARQSTASLLADPATPPELAARLELVEDILDFAESELSLPAQGQYRHYVALDRDAVVYNVMAAPRHDFAPLLWCFPIAGCVAYRGYFQRSRAEAKAAELAAEGFDVHVGGAAAYSTLGWFSDPLLSSFLWRDEADLAELLFHELAHVRVYLPGDTAFNESYATFVGQEGARRWLDGRGMEEHRRRWESRTQVRRLFVDFVLQWREKMAEGYRELRQQEAFEADLDALRDGLWSGMRAAWLEKRPSAAEPYDGFFLAQPSNARLNTVADYHGQLPAFAKLFAAAGADFAAFHGEVEALAQMSAAQRSERLAGLEAGSDQDSSR